MAYDSRPWFARIIDSVRSHIGAITHMDWNLFLRVFGGVFLAEFADKTQLLTMSFAASESNKWTVLVAAAAALIACSVVGVLAGTLLGRFVEGPWMRRITGAVLIIVGVLYLTGRV